MKTTKKVISVLAIISIAAQIIMTGIASFLNDDDRNILRCLFMIILRVILMAMLQYFTPAILIIIAVRALEKNPKEASTLSIIATITAVIAFPIGFVAGLFSTIERGKHLSYAFLIEIPMFILAVTTLVIAIRLSKKQNYTNLF